MKYAFSQNTLAEFLHHIHKGLYSNDFDLLFNEQIFAIFIEGGPHMLDILDKDQSRNSTMVFLSKL